MQALTNLKQVAATAADSIAYAIFNLANAKLEDLKPGLVESTDPAETALIAERDLRAALAYCHTAEAAIHPFGWRPYATAPRDGSLVDLWSAKDGGRRILNVRYLKAEDVDARYAKGGVWEHLTRDGWRYSTKDDAVLVEDQFTFWRPAEEDRPH